MNRKKALQFADFVGMPWRYTVESDYVSTEWGLGKKLPASWTGEILLIPPNRRADEIEHEVCHWLVTDEECRKLPEFDLGSSTYGDVWSVRTDHVCGTSVGADGNEIMTCFLHIYMLWKRGGHWRQLARGYSFDTAYNERISFEDFSFHPENIEALYGCEDRHLFRIVDRWLQS